MEELLQLIIDLHQMGDLVGQREAMAPLEVLGLKWNFDIAILHSLVCMKTPMN